MSTLSYSVDQTQSSIQNRVPDHTICRILRNKMDCRTFRLLGSTRNSFSHYWTMYLLLIIMLQQIQLDSCNPHNAVRNYQKRRLRTNDESDLLSQNEGESLPADKRTLTSATGNGGSISQPEEIFSVNDQLESNYDEYPMVVPKRAALLLDRLMVALHHALEKEHSGNTRLSDFYSKHNNGKNPATMDKEKTTDNDDAVHDASEKDIPYFTMYSDDDPSVMMDYDFKDLNSINRATGETRRANLGLDLGSDMGMDGVSSLLSASSSGHGGGGLISGVNNADISVGGGGRTNGRMYWRCYFNAVSCF
ncbi:allatostatin double C isoform X4 [Musca autumnalis]|uniref:allatostatin double C isoform X4 n=1 Tax=Musca autumnalis TaxID=221902 RepID=UPI003CEC80BF